MVISATTFPSVDIPHPLKLAGTFSPHWEYRAKMFVSRALIATLQSLLYSNLLTGFGESPEVLADWFFSRSDPETGRTTHTSNVCFFRDGYWSNEAAEEEAVLFCRRDHDFFTDGDHEMWRIHIPGDPQQDELLDVSSYGFGTHPDPGKQEALQSYVRTIINDQSAWMRVGADFGEDEERALVPAILAMLDDRFSKLTERFARLEQENHALHELIQSIQHVGQFSRCWNCHELTAQEELNDGICEACEDEYVHCIVCQKWLEQEEAHAHRHLFLGTADGDWLGSGGRDMDNHFEQRIKASLFVLLDNWTDVTMLIRVIQQSSDDYAIRFYGDRDCPHSMVCHLQMSDQNQSTYVSFEYIPDETREQMSYAVQWLATLDGAKTAAASLLTLTWIGEWQDSHQFNPT